MKMSGPEIFDETKAKSWQLASVVALGLAVIAIWVSPEFSLMNLGISMVAGLISFLLYLKLPRRFPVGALSLWALVLAGLWLSPLAQLSFETKRYAFAATVLFVSFVFQGPLAVYFAILLAGFGLCLSELAGGPVLLKGFVKSDSYLALLAGIGLGSAIIFARKSRTRSNAFLTGLKSAVAQTENAKERLILMQDNVQIARERLLGRTLTSGESLLGDFPTDLESTSDGEAAISFDLLIAELRQVFSDYQVKGRAEGRIAGPIRFVFFAPVAGYDEKARIAVDLAAVRSGVEACLTLALESLPEIGSRKREGVIRLSIRCGLRVVEVAIEDNGRGLTSRNLQAENDLGALKELVATWGGKFDRLARLGVGSRTSLELRILHERSRALPANARPARSPDFNSGRLRVEDVPRA